MRQLPVINRQSLYWDDFQRRAVETISCIKTGTLPPVRRVSIFITNQCNFRCRYCNQRFDNQSLSLSTFKEILSKYGDTAIIHITGGEPSTVKWLYPFLEENGEKYRFHLNTNAYIMPPAKSIRRLKVSLDSSNPEYWNALVGRKNAFDVVVSNIKKCIPDTVVSITCTLNKSNYKQAIDFAYFARKEFPNAYATFFSVYKGTNKEFAWDKESATDFFNNVLPTLKSILDEESSALISETIDEKIRLIQGERFPENSSGLCYLSMSERVFSPEGKEYRCSHLYRDGIFSTNPEKHYKCLYGCNRRLVRFNEEVEVNLS
jgi:MoaA/NifB/PqqE/SkfB family radical SAM enzyme